MNFHKMSLGGTDIHVILDHWRGINGNTKMFTESKVVDNGEKWAWLHGN